MTGHWAREAHKFDPLTGQRRRRPSRRQQRLQRKLVDKRLAEKEAWSELEMNHQRVSAFVSRPFDRYELVSASFRERHSLGSSAGGSARTSVREAAISKVAASSFAWPWRPLRSPT